MIKKIIFITATRAEFGKIKSLIHKFNKDKNFKVYIVVTGMHMIPKYGSTHLEVKKSFPKNKILCFKNQAGNETQDIIISNSIKKFSNIFKKISPDLIIIHGDRAEALSAVIAGSFNNFLIAHCEGGEVSGTIDEHIRHSVSKLSHVHFVSNKKARNRLIQLGEIKKNVFVTGSPETDIMKEMLSSISLNDVKERYGIKFKKYNILIYHPVTGENKKKILTDLNCLYKVILNSKNENFIIIYPNNDPGNNTIVKQYEKRFSRLKNTKLFRSIRFEYYLRLLKEANLILGNSSSGVREASFYGTPTINLGNRQQYRSDNKNIANIDFNLNKIISKIDKLKNKRFIPLKLYGEGNTASKILKIVQKKEFFKIKKQKILQSPTNS